MKMDKILLGLAVVLMTCSAVADLVQPQQLLESMAVLSLPAYFCTVLGAGKLVGVAALLVTQFSAAVPAFWREWAWAGFTIDLVGAVACHLLAGDSAHAAGPVIPLVVVTAAHVLDRRSRSSERAAA